MDAVATHVLAVVSSACRLCRSVHDADEDFAPARKGDGSPVTVCDFAIQAHVTGELRRRGLALPLVAEEDLKDASPQDLAVVRKLVEKFADHAFPREALPTPAAATAATRALRRRHPSPGDPPFSTGAPSSSPFFILDPIDGTRAFLRGDASQFAIGLALIDGEDGTPVVGALGLPNWRRAGVDLSQGSDLVLMAVRGGGAWAFSEGGGAPQRLRVARGTSLEDATVVLSESQAWRTEGSDVLALACGYGPGRQPKDTLHVCCGSLVKYACVAMGHAEAFVEHPVVGKERLNAWDHAAGVVLVQEAGGRVTDVEGRPLAFLPPPEAHITPRHGVVVASNGAMHDELAYAMRAGVELL